MFKNIFVAVTGDSSSLRTAMMSGARDVAKFDGSVAAMNTTLGKTKVLMGAAALGLGALAVGGLAYGASKAAEFDAKMRNVNSISRLNEEQFRALKEEALQLSTELPQSAAILADGLYDIASSGFQGAEGLQVLEASAAAAAAGLTTTEVSAKAVTAVLNAYGMEAAEAGDVSDTLFSAVDVGVITFEELASSVGDMVGIASAAGVSIQEVAAAQAAMTLSGLSAAEAGTSFQRLLQSLIDPSDELSAHFADLGYESGQAALDANGLYGTMELLRTTTDGSVESWMRLFPNIRSARAAFALTAAEGENYATTAERILDANERVGATQAVLEEQSKSLSFQWEMFTSSMTAHAIRAGDTVSPILADILGAANAFANDGIPAILSALSELRPLWEDVVSIGGDLWDVLTMVYEVAEPVARALAMAGIGGGIVLLRELLDVAAGLAGWLAENEAAVGLLATVLLSRMVPAATATVTQLAAMVATGAAGFMSNAAASARNMATGFDKAALKAAAANVAIAAAVVLIGSAIRKMSELQAEADEVVEGLLSDFGSEFDDGSLEQLQAQASGLREQLDLLRRTEPVGNLIDDTAADRWRYLVEYLPGVTPTLHEAQYELEALAEAERQAAADAMAMQSTIESAARQIAHALDLPEGSVSTDDVLALAEATGIDLTEAAWKVEPALIAAAESARDGVGAFDEQAESIESLASAHTSAVQAIQEFVDAQRALVDPVFAVHDAVSDLATAQAEADEALREHGSGSQEYKDATRGVVDAILQRDTAMANLNKAMLEGTVTQDDARRAIERWAESGEITEGQMDDLLATFEDVFGAAHDWNEITAEAVVGVDASDANAALDDVEGRLFGYDNTLVSADVDAYAGSAHDELEDIEGRLDDLDATTAKPKVTVGGGAYSYLGGVDARLKALNGRSATTYVRTVYSASGSGGPGHMRLADGGIIDIRRYAGGGMEDHQAQIAAAGAWRVWAEPETGGEAYIPMAPTKRVRSMAILEEVARRFGARLSPQAAGGVYLPGTSPARDLARSGASSARSDGGYVDNRSYSVQLPEAASNDDALMALRKESLRFD